MNPEIKKLFQFWSTLPAEKKREIAVHVFARTAFHFEAIPTMQHSSFEHMLKRELASAGVLHRQPEQTELIQP